MNLKVIPLIIEQKDDTHDDRDNQVIMVLEKKVQGCTNNMMRTPTDGFARVYDTPVVLVFSRCYYSSLPKGISGHRNSDSPKHCHEVKSFNMTKLLGHSEERQDCQY